MAAQTVAARLGDIDRLMEIHEFLGGTDRGRRYDLDVLNRSAIVLLTAVWEGYVEDLSAQSAAHLADHAQSPEGLPPRLRTEITKEIKESPHNYSGWELAGSGWRDIVKSRQAAFALTDARGLNTPKTDQVNKLFKHSIDLGGLSSAWHWNGMAVKQAEDKLNNMVVLRGDIAHGSGAARAVGKTDVTSYRRHVEQLVSSTDKEVNRYVTEVTGEGDERQAISLAKAQGSTPPVFGTGNDPATGLPRTPHLPGTPLF